jgi:tetratricopeptide (TPR) repeat protein
VQLAPFFLKRFLLPLLAALSLSTAVNAEGTENPYQEGSLMFYITRAYNRLEAGDYSGALADYDIVIGKKDLVKKIFGLEEFDKIYMQRGNAKSNLGDHSGALSDFNKALSLNSSDPLIYYNRGLAWFRLQNTSKGCKDFKKASSLGDSYADKIIERYCM